MKNTRNVVIQAHQLVRSATTKSEKNLMAKYGLETLFLNFLVKIQDWVALRDLLKTLNTVRRYAHLKIKWGGKSALPIMSWRGHRTLLVYRQIEVRRSKRMGDSVCYPKRISKSRGHMVKRTGGLRSRIIF